MWESSHRKMTTERERKALALACVRVSPDAVGSTPASTPLLRTHHLLTTQIPVQHRCVCSARAQVAWALDARSVVLVSTFRTHDLAPRRAAPRRPSQANTMTAPCASCAKRASFKYVLQRPALGPARRTNCDADVCVVVLLASQDQSNHALSSCKTYETAPKSPADRHPSTLEPSCSFSILVHGSTQLPSRYR